ncbi:MAG: hypothetical protein Q4A52_01435, partial [Bacillota bacterium]|nr:hypothetical protein [Bacillota bacterium]
ESPGAGDVFRVGYNTDWAGLEAILPADIAQYRAAVILGTGASARMAASVLRARGIQNLAWISRRKEGQREMMSASRACCPSRQERVAGASMAPEMMCCYEELESAARYSSNPLADLIARRPVILVNATPVGTLGNPAPLLVSEETIARFDAVIDLVYNPPETKLIAIARRGSAYTATGIEMLIMQAIEAQILWGTIPQAAWKNDRRAFVRALAARIREDLGI